jgi:hypothetical protein
LIGFLAVSAVMVGLTFVPIAPVQANDELVPANGGNQRSTERGSDGIFVIHESYRCA